MVPFTIFNFSDSDGVWSAEGLEIEIDEETLYIIGEVPKSAGLLLRPNILMFGDYYWESSRTDKQYKMCSNYIETYFDGEPQNRDY